MKYLYGGFYQREKCYIWIKKGKNPYGWNSLIEYAKRFTLEETKNEYLKDEGFRYYSMDEVKVLYLMIG